MCCCVNTCTCVQGGEALKSFFDLEIHPVKCVMTESCWLNEYIFFFFFTPLVLTCINGTKFNNVSTFPHSAGDCWYCIISCSVETNWRLLSAEHVSVTWLVAPSDRCLSSVWCEFISSTGVCHFEKKLISFQSHLLLYSLTVSLLCSFPFCKSNRISVFLSTAAIQKPDCFVHHHQNTEESIAIHLCSEVWNHLVSLSLY